MLKALRLANVQCKDRANAVSVRALAVTSIMLAVYMTGLAIGAQQTHTPDGSAVIKAVESYFASQPGYQSGDLITRSQVEKVLAKLQAAKVKVKDSAGIAKLALADDSFIVRELSTPEGHRFMRKIAHDSGTYSRLDRLSTIPRGQTTVRDLIRQKDGDKFVEYLATTKGGKNMGNMIGGARGGVDLNKPTGRIYTVDDFTTVLKVAIEKP